MDSKIIGKMKTTPKCTNTRVKKNECFNKAVIKFNCSSINLFFVWLTRARTLQGVILA